MTDEELRAYLSRVFEELEDALTPDEAIEIFEAFAAHCRLGELSEDE